MKKLLNLFIFILSGLFIFSSFNPVFARTIPDVPGDHTFYQDISNLMDKNIVTGYPDGSFKPDEFLDRGQLAGLIVKTLGMKKQTEVEPYKDIAYDFTFVEEIHTLRSYGIGDDFGDNTYRPNTKVTRGKAIEFIVKATRVTKTMFNDNITTRPIYKDIDYGDEYSEFIHIASSYVLFDNTRIVTGYQDGNFGSDDKIKRGQFARFLNKTLQMIDEGAVYNPPLPIENKGSDVKQILEKTEQGEITNYHSPRECDDEYDWLKTTEIGDIFVSPNGDDFNDGDPIRPLKTIGEALCRVNDGQNIQLMPGTYPESIRINDLHDVTITGKFDSEGRRPIIDGENKRLFAVEFQNPSKLTIENIDFANFTDQAIHVKDGTNINLRNNRFYRNGFASYDDNLHEEGYGVILENTIGIAIERNQAYENGPNPGRVSNGVTGAGILIDNSEDLILRGNKLNNNIGSGFIVFNSKDIQIHGNEIERNYIATQNLNLKGAITLDRSNNIDVFDNIINSNAGPGIIMRYDNLLYPEVTKDISIEKNKITNNQWGIFLMNKEICDFARLADQKVIMIDNNNYLNNVSGDTTCKL